MSQKLSASMPAGLDLDSNYIIRFTAVDAVTGATVTAVKVSNASLLVAQLSAGSADDLAFGPFEPQFVPIDFNAPGGTAAAETPG